MKAIRRAISQWLAQEDGPTTVEYAILLALILMMAMTAIRSLGGGVEGRWKHNADLINSSIKAPLGG